MSSYINTDTLRSVASFLADNEQFGDDWSEEIAELDKVIKFFDKKQSVKNLPTADQIWSILNEDLDWPFSIKLDSPFGCDMKIVSVGDDVYVDFYDNQAGALATKQHFLFWNENMTSADIEKHCQEYDYWADHFEFL